MNAVRSPLEPSVRAKGLAAVLVVAYALVSLIPLAWIFATSLRTPGDAIAYPPKLVAEPSLVGWVNLFTTRSRVGADEMAALPPPQGFVERTVREQQMILAGPSRFGDRYLNSLLVGFGSTLLSVALGTLAAYAFSRFRVPGKDDLLFFILSTRMMPPIAVAIPIFLMYRQLGLSDTHLGLVLLYTNFETLSSMQRQLGYLRAIARNHLLVVIFFENTELAAVVNAPAPTTAEVYRKAVAEKFMLEKRQIVRELALHGIDTILTPPELLTVGTINKYLEIKARRLI